MLEVQTGAFQRHPYGYAGGTNSCFLKTSLRWRYNPTLVVPTPLTLTPAWSHTMASIWTQNCCYKH